MSGHFDNTQTIKLADGGLILGGPQVLETGETVERLDVWVWQDDCVCVVKGNPQVGGTWSITTTPGLHHVGAFRAGPATAMALMVTKKGVATEAYQWTQGISLSLEVPKTV
jgi:hypothetical protein